MEVPFDYATMREMIECIKCLVEEGADVDAKDDKGKTALFSAAMFGKIESIECLVEQGADVNAQDNGGMTCIFWAAKASQIESIKCLEKLKADVNARDNYGGTPLIFATVEGLFESVQCLVKLGADVNAEAGGMTAKMFAVECGRVEIANWLSDTKRKFGTPVSLGIKDARTGDPACQSSVTIPSTSKAPESPQSKEPNITIFEAVKQGDLEVFQHWLKMTPAIVNTQNTDTNGWPFFHFVAQNCPNVGILQILMDHYGMDANAKDDSTGLPLCCVAAWNFNVKILKYLISRGMNVNEKDNVGATPLHYAARVNSNVEILEYLVNQGVNVNAIDKYGYTPLHYAAELNSDVEILKYLVNRGANVNAKTTSHVYTPLHFAARDNSNVEILKQLVSCGADVNAKDIRSRTPLDLANSDEKQSYLRNIGKR